MNRSIQNRLVVSILFLLTACGGGDPNTPPPPVSGADTEALKTLQKLAQNASQTCCNGAADFMIKVGTAITTNNPAAAPTKEPDMNACNTAIMNFEMQFRTMGNGQYAQNPQAQQWRDLQGRAVVDCIGGKMQGAGLPVNDQTIPLYFMAAQSLTQKLRNAVPNIQLSPNVINPRSSLGGSGPGLGFRPNNPRGLIPTYGTGTNPYATNGTGTNPYATGSGTNYTSTQPPLNSTFGAPRFDSPNASNEIFGSVPTFPGWQASNL